MEADRCTRTVAINFPCSMSEGHTGVCHPDPEGQLRIYGITVEDLRRIQQDLKEARILGLTREDGRRTSLASFVVLKARLLQLVERQKAYPYAYLDVQRAIDEAEEHTRLLEPPTERLT